IDQNCRSRSRWCRGFYEKLFARSRYLNSGISCGMTDIPKDKIDLGLGTGLILNSNTYQCSLLKRKYHKKEDRQANILGFSVALNANKIINSNPKMDVFSSLEDYKNRHIRNDNHNPNDDLITISDSSDVSIIAENIPVIIEDA
ncbi:hypothetical protein, partial [Vibrio vulnificus]|uniref:hypothetical protein n=1 Tax=Vibrio vulnificus TaxID=672 RepID=UPI0040592713